MFIGLTGGIGSGKSTVLGFFEKQNWNTIEADSIVHSLYSDTGSDFFSSLINRWGKVILNNTGRIDRGTVSQIIFSSETEREWIHCLLHPAVLNKALRLKQESEYVIFAVPLLYEVKWEKHFDKIVSVWTTPELCRERLLKRGLTQIEIERRQRAQMPQDEKLEKADYALMNNGSPDMLKKQCIRLSTELKKII